VLAAKAELRDPFGVEQSNSDSESEGLPVFETRQVWKRERGHGARGTEGGHLWDVSLGRPGLHTYSRSNSRYPDLLDHILVSLALVALLGVLSSCRELASERRDRKGASYWMVMGLNVDWIRIIRGEEESPCMCVRVLCVRESVCVCAYTAWTSLLACENHKLSDHRHTRRDSIHTSRGWTDCLLWGGWGCEGHTERIYVWLLHPHAASSTEQNNK
jgi:hypothetical protein